MTVSKPRILLAGPLDEKAEHYLDEHAEVVRPAASNEAALCEAVAGCAAIVARTHSPVTAAVLSAGATKLKVVGVAGVGLDNVDLVAAEQMGVRVLNRATAASNAVAEYTIWAMLSSLRCYDEWRTGLASGEFASLRQSTGGRELHELTIGIIGMGNIGTRIGRICTLGFNARVIYNDIRKIDDLVFPAKAVDFATIWRESDIVTLHVPLTEQTHGFINANAFATATRKPVLINSARGAVVATDALVTALRDQKLAGAVLDVTDPEPLPLDHPLRGMPNCIITPHIASRTAGGLRRMLDVVEDVIAALKSG